MNLAFTIPLLPPRVTCHNHCCSYNCWLTYRCSQNISIHLPFPSHSIFASYLHSPTTLPCTTRKAPHSLKTYRWPRGGSCRFSRSMKVRWLIRVILNRSSRVSWAGRLILTLQLEQGYWSKNSNTYYKQLVHLRRYLHGNTQQVLTLLF